MAKFRKRMCSENLTILKVCACLVFLCVCHKEVSCYVPTTPDQICAPNPPSPSALQIAPPYVNCYSDVQAALAKGHPDKDKPTDQVLDAYGYSHKVHELTTEDGYILNLYQITGSPKDKHRKTSSRVHKRKNSILLQHGLFSASDNWFWQPVHRSFPMKLADMGYDVWIGNIRGCTYSQKHIKYKANEHLAYWDFSWHEMGIYDIPKMINHILKISKNEKIFYVGHSMGTAMTFVALSEIPEMNNKIYACFMLAPVAFIGHLNNAIKLIFPEIEVISKVDRVNEVAQGYISSSNGIAKAFNIQPGSVCEVSAANCGLCDNLLYVLFGFNAPQANYTEIPNVHNKFPNAASIKTLSHFGQCNKDCVFRKYDYGTTENLRRYKTITPPNYHLNRIHVPQYFYYADNDNLATPNDVRITASHFKKGVVRDIYQIKNTLFNHMDFLLAKDADKLVYNKILDRMREIEIENERKHKH